MAWDCVLETPTLGGNYHRGGSDYYGRCLNVCLSVCLSVSLSVGLLVGLLVCLSVFGHTMSLSSIMQLSCFIVEIQMRAGSEDGRVLTQEWCSDGH